MPTEQPNTAANTDLPDDARDGESAAAVLHDDGLDAAPGGGGLRGPAAASGTPGAGGAAPRGPSPNSPTDVPVPASALGSAGESAAAARDARTEATR